jgi:hypothetical protein
LWCTCGNETVDEKAGPEGADNECGKESDEEDVDGIENVAVILDDEWIWVAEENDGRSIDGDPNDDDDVDVSEDKDDDGKGDDDENSKELLLSDTCGGNDCCWLNEDDINPLHGYVGCNPNCGNVGNRGIDGWPMILPKGFCRGRSNDDWNMSGTGISP